MSNRIRATDSAAPEFIVQLRDARVRGALTQRDLAAQLGWDLERLRSYETGSRSIHPRLLAQWAAALGLTVACVPAAGPGEQAAD